MIKARPLDLRPLDLDGDLNDLGSFCAKPGRFFAGRMFSRKRLIELLTKANLNTPNFYA
jgi:hypothetical protein